MKYEVMMENIATGDWEIIYKGNYRNDAEGMRNIYDEGDENIKFSLYEWNREVNW